jgi:hypothetical protein
MTHIKPDLRGRLVTWENAGRTLRYVSGNSGSMNVL